MLVFPTLIDGMMLSDFYLIYGRYTINFIKKQQFEGNVEIKEKILFTNTVDAIDKGHWGI